MTPEQQAEALGRWLEGARGPEGLDNDVVEAVIAIRPDLAPPPRVRIDDVLAAIDAAPGLARWVDGDAPPSNLDSDVAEAVWALRPELAPAPRVSIDDILGRVTTGPLAPGRPERAEIAAAAPTAVVPFPRKEPAAPLPDSRKRMLRPWHWLAGGGAGLVAAAAAAVLVVTASVQVADRLEAPAPSESWSSPPAADAPAPAPEPMAAAEDAPTLRPKAKPRPVEPRVGGEGSEATASSKSAAGPAPAREGEIDDLDAVADGVDLELDAPTDATLRRDETAEIPVSSPTSTGSEAGGYTNERDARMAEEQEQTAAAPRQKNKPATSAAPATESSRAIPSDGYTQPEPTAPGASQLDAATRARMAELESRASSLAAQGKYAEAAQTLAPAIAPPSSVGQYYATWVSQWYLAAGQVQNALDAAQRGINLASSAPSGLWRAYGNALEAAGRPAAADEAYDHADGL